MDFLNKAYEQLSDLIRSMTPATRVTTALLLAMVVVSTAFLFRGQSDNSDEFLFGAQPLTSSEVSAIEAAFSKAGLTTWDVEGNRIRVPRLQKGKYIAALAEENALPKDSSAYFTQMFATNSMTDTRDVRERKARFALEQSLARTIREISGIEMSTVTISEVSAGSFPPRKELNALVSVKSNGNNQMDDHRVRSIRNMVSSGAGVPETNITVTDLNSGRSFQGHGRDGGALDNQYADAQASFEVYYRRLISDRLSYVPGVIVSVGMELEKELVSRTNTLKYDDKPSSIASNTYTKEATSTKGNGGGRPGAVPNGVAGNSPMQLTATDSNESTTNETREDQKSVYGATQTVTEKAPFVPTRVTASIGVPESYFASVWIKHHPAAPGEEQKQPSIDDLAAVKSEVTKTIQEAVVALLPEPPKGEDIYPDITVIPYVETPLAAPSAPNTVWVVTDWFMTNWTTIGMFGLAAFGLIFLRGMIRSAQNAVHAGAQSEESKQASRSDLESEEAEFADDEDDINVNSLKRRFQGSGKGLRDELTELVREDPDAAASVLQLWITEAA